MGVADTLEVCPQFQKVNLTCLAFPFSVSKLKKTFSLSTVQFLLQKKIILNQTCPFLKKEDRPYFLRALFSKLGWEKQLERIKLKLGVFEFSTGPTKKTLTVLRLPIRLVRLLKPLMSMETTVAQLKVS